MLTRCDGWQSYVGRNEAGSVSRNPGPAQSTGGRALASGRVADPRAPRFGAKCSPKWLDRR